MGHLMLPPSETVSIDANVVIYSIEKIPPYRTILQPLWQAVQSQHITVVTSDLTLMETLIKPFQTHDTTMEHWYRALFVSPGVRLAPISQQVLERAAQLRATTRLRTPDAIHAATALDAQCALFVTNDRDYRQCPGLTVALLSDYVAP
jgi:predicted nucleic acid-binding protein